MIELRISTIYLSMDIHNSVMEIRDLRYKYLTAIMYFHHLIMAAHNAKLWYP